MQQFSMTTPDDWHIHLRDNQYLTTTVSHAVNQFHRAIIMPNLKPAITTTELALAYQKRILDACPKDANFAPLMTLYLTDTMPVHEIIRAKDSGVVVACKLYPAGATTHSEAGVTSLEKLYPVLEAMETANLPLLIHGEVTDPTVDIFDREKTFIDLYLNKIIDRFKQLRIVLEHITTKDAVEFVKQTPKTIAATLTPHHLLLNRNDLLAGGIKPHHYCLPVLKRKLHQDALVAAAISGNPKFFLGTDSAPHAQQLKENACGCAGIYSAHAAIELYAEIFEANDALDKLEGFASFYGADFYQLPRNKTKITLKKETWKIPDYYDFGNERLIPLKAGEEIQWKICV